MSKTNLILAGSGYLGDTIIDMMNSGKHNYSIIEKKFWDLFNYYDVNSIAGVPYTYSILKKLNFQ